MEFYFSAETGGLYLESVHDNIPADAVSVTRERHAELMAEQAAGKVIVADANGQPIAASPPPMPDELAFELLRRRRDELLQRSDIVHFPDVPLSDEQRAALIAYRQALRDLPATVTDPTAVEWPVAPA